MIVHDGRRIPTADPKAPTSNVWYGFSYPLKDTETISVSKWSINDTEVVNGQEVDGLTFEQSMYSDGVTEVQISGGTVGVRYKLTNTISTNLTPLDTRSMYIRIKKL